MQDEKGKRTIEEKLHSYCEKDKSERCETLWHSWNNNKRLLSQLLELTLPSFPTYSSHNESHAKTVLHNIESILGTKGINNLSPTDCFMLLNTAYLHDIGMCITNSDRKGMVNSNEFVKLLDYIYSDNLDLKKDVEIMKQSCYPNEDGLSQNKRIQILKKKYSEKLDVYTAVINLMAEFQRSSHAKKSAERINDWVIGDDNELGIGMRLSGIPLRILLRIADCARLHTDWEFDHIMSLPEYDDGYAHDLMHPRFIAVMLQLGDALDLDNDRFHSFTMPFVGHLPSTSLMHYKKHQSIRRLTITNKDIYIEADCDDQAVYRLLRKECDGLESILQKASYNWSRIAPSDLNAFLPTLHSPKIVLKGKEIPHELVNARFNISQSRAFRLIEGANIYNNKFAFLRELVQNALDATKLQAWRDVQYSSKYNEIADHMKNKDGLEGYGLVDVLKYINVNKYPIIIKFCPVVKVYNESDEEHFISMYDYYREDERQTIYHDIQYGVLLKVQDFGTGISTKDIKCISSVGSSYENRFDEIIGTPECLKPTGEFGIGLQSCFLVCNHFRAKTHTYFGDTYDMSFSSASNDNAGYINITPIDNYDKSIPYGTEFEIFIDISNKLPHSECMDAWDTSSKETDIFSQRYDEMRPKRHAKELIAQLVLYIDGLLNEPIFPISVELNAKDVGNNFVNFLIEKIHTIKINYIGGTKQNSPNSDPCWLNCCINNNEDNKDNNDYRYKNYIYSINESGACAIDVATMKLHVWSKNSNTFAVFGAYQLVGNDESSTSYKSGGNTNMYLKGIHIGELSLESDACLLEKMDIHMAMKKSMINLSRGGFTDEGIEFIKTKIFPGVLKTAVDGLKKFTNKHFLQLKLIEKDLVNQKSFYLDGKLDDYIAKRTFHLYKNRERALSAIVLIYLYTKYDKSRKLFQTNLLNKFMEKLRLRIETAFKLDGYGKSSKLRIYAAVDTSIDRQVADLATNNRSTIGTFIELLNTKNRIAIIGFRDRELNSWINIPYIICDQSVINLLESQMYISSNNYWNAFKQLEEYGDKIIEKINKDRLPIINKWRNQQQPNQRLFIWLMKNMSVQAQFISDDENTIMYILSYDNIPCTLYNENAKYIQLRKIYNSKQKYPRYSTRAWADYFYLGVESLPKSVYCINSGLKSYAKHNHLILPYTGNAICSIFDFVMEYENQNKDYFDNLEKTSEKIVKSTGIFRRNLSSPVSFNNNSALIAQIANNGEDWADLSNKLRDYNRKFLEQIRKVYYDVKNSTHRLNDIAEDIPEPEDVLLSVKDDVDTDIVNKLAKGIDYIINGAMVEIVKKMKSDIKKDDALHEAQFASGMVSFYKSNTTYIKEDIENGLNNLKDDIVNLVLKHSKLKFIELAKESIFELLKFDERKSYEDE